MHMKTHLAAAALLAALVQPVSATQFSNLTIIYIGSGVVDSGHNDNLGVATSIHCSNVSGVTVQVRAHVYNPFKIQVGAVVTNLENTDTFTFSTHQTLIFSDAEGDMSTLAVQQGMLVVSATNSAI